MEQKGSSAIASPIRSPPPEPAAEAHAPPPPPTQPPALDPSRLSPDNPTPAHPHPASPAITARPSDGTGDSSPPEPAAEAQASPPLPLPPTQLPGLDPSRLSPDNSTPAPPLPAAPTITAPPSDGTGDSSPPSPPSHPKTPTPPPISTADRSPPLPTGYQAPRPPAASPPPAPAPTPPPPPAPASPEAKSDQEADEAADESEKTQTEEVMPQKEAAVAESPAGSPQKESALTIAKLLSGEVPAAKEANTATDKVAPEVVTESVAGGGGGVGGGGGGGGRGGVGSKRWLLRGVPEKVRRTELKRAELGFRVSAAVFCLVSLSVMSAGSTPGWAGDSFRRYNEYRYTLAASVMAFTYSGFQLVAEVHHLVTGRRIIGASWGNYFNLAMDQILAYLLLSASSAALSRNDVWVSRFGVDQFAKLINSSASMAFLAFIALGLSSIISAYRVFSSIS
ncbi:unnamed protein product [Alopecurus aequalis]